MKSMGWAAAAAAMGLGLTFASPAAALPGCEAFLQKMRAEGSDIGVEYSRALVVSRVHTTRADYDITTNADVDGTLVCQGDQFVRFEAHALEPMRRQVGRGLRAPATARHEGRARLGRLEIEIRITRAGGRSAVNIWPPRASAATSISPARPSDTSPAASASA